MTKVNSFTYVPYATSAHFLEKKNPAFSAIAQKQLRIAEHLIESYNSSYFGLNYRDIDVSCINLSGDVKMYRRDIQAVRQDIQDRRENPDQPPKTPPSEENPSSDKVFHGYKIDILKLSSNSSLEDVETALNQFEGCVNALEATIPQFEKMKSAWRHSCQIL